MKIVLIVSVIIVASLLALIGFLASEKNKYHKLYLEAEKTLVVANESIKRQNEKIKEFELNMVLQEEKYKNRVEEIEERYSDIDNITSRGMECKTIIQLLSKQVSDFLIAD